MITEYIINNLKQNGVLESKDEAIIHFGLNGLLSTIFSFISIILIGLYCDCLMESIIFTISFFFLRIYAGGYHADTPIKCYGTSLAISITVFYIIHRLNLGTMILTFIFILSSITVLILSPLDTPNKPLDQEEYKFYKKKTYKIVGIYIILFILTLLIKQYSISWSICMTTFIVALLQITSITKTITITGEI